MATSDFVFDPASNFAGKAEAITIDYFAALNAMPLIAPANEWWKPFTQERPGAKLKTRFHMPIMAPRAKPWKGSVELDSTGKVFFDLRRKVKTLGVKALAQEIAEFDFGAFSRAPEVMARIVGKIPQDDIAAALNRAFTTLDWTGTNFATLASGTLKPNNPLNGSVGTFYNAFQNSALTPDNIKAAIVNVQSRVGFDGKTLELDPMWLWVPYSMKEKARDLTEVQRLLPLNVDGVEGGGNDSPVFGRLKVVAIPGMREDLWVVAASPTDEFLKPFARVLGGPVSEYGINRAESGGGTPQVPHLETILFDRTSEMYKTKLQLGVAMIINEGSRLASSQALCLNYTGVAS